MEQVFNKQQFFDQAVEIPEHELKNIKSCLILAPHPDDESLGCGGLIALLRSLGTKVWVILTTDGSQSHPNSKKCPPNKLAQIRKNEVIKALDILGVPESNILFFEGKDAALPAKNEAGFEMLKQKLAEQINSISPELILVPYELDPHCDHRATWQLLNQAIFANSTAKIWEYPIWLYELAAAEDIPILKEGELKKINIERYLPKKINAIEAHISQTTKMIDDDPTGFILTEKVIANFTSKFEYFIERP